MTGDDGYESVRQLVYKYQAKCRVYRDGLQLGPEQEMETEHHWHDCWRGETFGHLMIISRQWSSQCPEGIAKVISYPGKIKDMKHACLCIEGQKYL